MFRPAKNNAEQKQTEEPKEKKSVDATVETIVKACGGIQLTRGWLQSDKDFVSAIKSGTWNIDNLLNPHPVTVDNWPEIYPISIADIVNVQITQDGGYIDPREIRALTKDDIVTPHGSLDKAFQQFEVGSNYPLKTYPLGAHNQGLNQDEFTGDLDVQIRHNGDELDPRQIKMREDLTSLGGVASPNAAGVQIIAGSTGKYIKVYDAGFHAGADGLHYFYFGTTTTATTKRFLTCNKALCVQKTFVQPRVGNESDGLYLYSSVSETNMPYDVGYVQE